jgi:glycosyltransferase involved in cell wall biosynthesis
MTANHLVDMNDTASWLSGLCDRNQLEEDIWRLEHGWFGPHYMPQSPGKGLLLVGLRSGLEAALALKNCPQAKVVAINKRDSIVARPLVRALKDLGEDRISFGFVEEWNDRWSAVDVVRFDRAHWRDDCADQIITRVRPRTLVGEAPMIGSVSAGRLLRKLRGAIDQHYLRIAETSVVLSGASPVEIAVSVIVPAYGVEQYIDRCLESLTSQTLERIEIIVVDDGSKDQSGVIADAWQARAPGKVRVIHQANTGCAGARMTGLRAAQGEYVAFVDADDWVSPRMLERLHTAAAVHRAEITQCGYFEAYEDGKRVEVIDCNRNISPVEGDWGMVLEQPFAYLPGRPTIWRRLYRRDFLANCGAEFPVHLPRFDDLPFQFITLASVRRMVVLPEAHYFYNSQRPGQDISVRDSRLFVHFPIFDWLGRRTREWATPSIEKYLARAELNTHIWALQVLASDLKANYRRQAAIQFLRRRPALSLRALYGVCIQHSHAAFWFLIRSVVLSLFGPPKRPIRDTTLRGSGLDSD